MRIFIRLFVLITLSLLTHGCIDFESEADQLTRLSEFHSINIIVGNPKENGASQDTQAPVIEFPPTLLEEAGETLDGIEQALSVYPEGFVSSMIGAIFITGQIRIEGVEAGATYGPDWIAISNTPEWNGTKANFENGRYAIHHELSSIVLSKRMISRISWRSLMPTTWVPASSEAEALNTPKKAQPSYDQGFLSGYAKTSVGNDFSVYAEYVFGTPDRLIELAKTHQVIAQKVGLLMSVYSGIDSRFNTYFDKTGLQRIAQPTGPTEIQMTLDVSGIKPTRIGQRSEQN